MSYKGVFPRARVRNHGLTPSLLITCSHTLCVRRWDPGCEKLERALGNVVHLRKKLSTTGESCKNVDSSRLFQMKWAPFTTDY